MKVNFEIDKSHLPLWENQDWRYAILMGGRGNGRSGTASRYTVSKLLGKEYTRGAIMRATREDIRASCWGELNDRLKEQNIFNQFRVTDNDMFLERGQNSVKAHGFRASSGSLTARLKSLAGYNFIWIEEAEEIGEEEFRTLDDTLRTVKGKIRIIFTLNTPPKNHWILKKWFDLEPTVVDRFYKPKLKEGITDVLYLPGNWTENAPNLDEHTLFRYKNYQYTNPDYYWQVIEGLSPEEVRGKIYTGWNQIDSVPKEARLVKFGEDFGWFPDPACVCAIYYWNGAYVVDEIAYGTELTNEFLAGEIKKVGQAMTVADSAEPKSIEEQRRYGIMVTGAEKGKDSVSFRIKVTNQKKIYVTKRSKNIWESYENYRWAEDKDGNPKGEPDHHWSHCFAPETLVHTTKGKIRIDELVGKEGYLYSRNGRIEKFYNVRPTRKDTEVVSLTFNDGDTLTVTLDHLLLLPNGQWIESGLLCPKDMIQSCMYDKDSIKNTTRILWKNVYEIFQRKILQGIYKWKEELFAQSNLAISQWSYSEGLSYPPQKPQQGRQFYREFGIETSDSTSFGTHDTGKERATKRMDKENQTTSEQMAWVKRGTKVSLMAWKEKLGREKTYYQRMCSMPQKIRNTYQSAKRKILQSELFGKSQTKTITGIARGFCKQTYNLEVEGTHCLMANGVIAHNCMDAVSYAIASMHNKTSDIITFTGPPKKRVNPAR